MLALFSLSKSLGSDLAYDFIGAVHYQIGMSGTITVGSELSLSLKFHDVEYLAYINMIGLFLNIIW